MNDQDQQKMEQELRALVWKQASTMPTGVPLPRLAVELVATMGDRSSERKLALMAMTYVAAMKMLVELVPDPETQS